MKKNRFWINNFFAKIFIFLIKVYQYTFAFWLGGKCRFTPSCSEYSLEAFKKYGFIKGFKLSFKRILSCRPGGRSGYDPLP